MHRKRFFRVILVCTVLLKSFPGAELEKRLELEYPKNAKTVQVPNKTFLLYYIMKIDNFLKLDVVAFFHEVLASIFPCGCNCNISNDLSISQGHRVAVVEGQV
jgi:hypothetical protein